MKMTKRVWAWALMLVVGFGVFAPMALAQEAGSTAEVAEYAAREAGSPGLEAFEGGYVGVLGALAIVVILPMVAIALVVGMLSGIR